MTILEAWNERNRLSNESIEMHNEAEKLYKECREIGKEGWKFYDKAKELRATARKLLPNEDILWTKRFHAENAKLHFEVEMLRINAEEMDAQGNELYDKERVLKTEGQKLYIKGKKLFAEGQMIFYDAIIKNRGNIEIELNGFGMIVEGIQYEWQPIKNRWQYDYDDSNLIFCTKEKV